MYLVLSFLFLVSMIFLLSYVILTNEGWKFGLYPSFRYVGLRDAKLGLVLSSNCEIVPRSGRIALNLGLFLWLLSLKFEYVRPDTSQRELDMESDEE